MEPEISFFKLVTKRKKALLQLTSYMVKGIEQGSCLHHMNRQTGSRSNGSRILTFRFFFGSGNRRVVQHALQMINPSIFYSKLHIYDTHYFLVYCTFSKIELCLKIYGKNGNRNGVGKPLSSKKYGWQWKKHWWFCDLGRSKLFSSFLQHYKSPTVLLNK